MIRVHHDDTSGVGFMRVRMIWRAGQATLHLDDKPINNQLLKALPIRAEAHTWGEEVYFRVPVRTALDPDATQIVKPGTVCFWVEGESLAIPYGPTPISQKGECRLVTKVNRLGRLVGDARVLESVRSGDSIRLEPAAD